MIRTTFLHEKAKECIKEIRSVDFNQLEISNYNKEYIGKILPVIDYYFDIYTHTLSLFRKIDDKKSLVVDFGGGHGFLSLFLKSLGFAVIYCDLNERSVETVTKLKEQLGFGPDYIVHGSTRELINFCKSEGITPDYLLATDVIEHVYDLHVMYEEMQELNPNLHMGFTTASNPENKWKCRKLRKMMQKAEQEYLQKRIDFITQKVGKQASKREIRELAVICRGLHYGDIDQAIPDFLSRKQTPMDLTDPFNTCDPENGNWMERILSFEVYERIALDANFATSFYPGYYNEKHYDLLLGFIYKGVNFFIRRNPARGVKIAPYVVLKVIPCSD